MDDILYSTITKADIGSNTCPFNNNKFLIFNFALVGAYPVKINGAKEPYNGLPAATVKLIKNNQGKMLVD